MIYSLYSLTADEIAIVEGPVLLAPQSHAV